MPFNAPSFWRDRLKASGVHLSISLAIALLAAFLVFGIWYPYPYSEISGGRELFTLVVSVDVILGPLITLAIFDRKKGWAVLRRDLLVIAMIQLSALGYGLRTVFVARPVHMVFEGDRFTVVHAVEVPHELLVKSPAGVEAMPLTGPTMLATRPFKDNNEKFEMTLAALQGMGLAARPDLWQPYAPAVADVLKAAKPVTQLRSRFAAQAREIDETLRRAGVRSENALYLPMGGAKAFWTVFLDPQSAQIVAAMPLDSF